MPNAHGSGIVPIMADGDHGARVAVVPRLAPDPSHRRPAAQPLLVAAASLDGYFVECESAM